MEITRRTIDIKFHLSDLPRKKKKAFKKKLEALSRMEWIEVPNIDFSKARMVYDKEN